MPSSQTCQQWIDNSCSAPGGGGGGGGGWGSCGSCSSCPPGPSNQCVTDPNGNCVWDPGTCGGGGTAECTVEWQPTGTTTTGPITMYVGQTVSIQAFARGALDGWESRWRWVTGQPTLGTFSPSTYTSGTATFVSNFTATTPGLSQFRTSIHDSWFTPDWDTNCANTRFINVIACTPTCTAQCGQTNGCGGNCGTSDDGGPATPTNLLVNGTAPVANIFTVTPSSNQLPITWNAVTGAEAYEIRITPQGGVECSGGNTICTTTATGSYTWTNIPAGVTTWQVRVRAINTSCAAFGGTDNGAWTATYTINLVGAVTGNFYFDPTSSCNPAVATPITPGTGSYISLSGLGGYLNQQGPSLSSSSYSFSNAPYWTSSANNVITFYPGLDGTGTPYRCGCGTDTGGTCVLSGLSSPSTSNNFFLGTVTNPSWWQVWGGNIYSAASSGGGITSPVPPAAACSGTCTPYLLATTATGTPETAGIAVTNGSQIDTTSDSDGFNTSRLTERGSAVFNTATEVLGTPSGRQDFAFFKARFGLGNAPTNDGFDPLNATKPSGTPVNGGEAYYYDGDVIIKNPWSVGAGETVVVFVDGNLTITDEAPANEQLITVANGGFLTFVVSGNLTIDSVVGNASTANTTPNLEGIYLVNGTISTGTGGAGADSRLVIGGSLVGWSGINFQRTLPTAANTTTPAELVIFRPDLVRNLPDPMTRPSYTWQETN